MARKPRSGLIKSIARQRIEESMWGIPESPEFSAEQHLLNEFKAHENDEAHLLENYKNIAEESEDPLIRFLLGLIIADEQRHDQILDRMISRLKDDLAWSGTKRRSSGKSAAAAKNDRVRATLQRFLQIEVNGIKEYERLSKASGALGHTLFNLLCRTIIHDSEKHIGILEFLRLRLREPRRARRKRKE